ncbi:hypothetical protein [Arthrobacter monumenti]
MHRARQVFIGGKQVFAYDDDKREGAVAPQELSPDTWLDSGCTHRIGDRGWAADVEPGGRL